MSDTKILIYIRIFLPAPLRWQMRWGLIASGWDRRRIAQRTGLEQRAVTVVTLWQLRSRLCHMPIADSGYVSETGDPKRANPPKGGDAKPPVYGHVPTTAGLPT